MSWTILRWLGWRGCLAALLLVTNAFTFCMWRHEVARKHAILFAQGQAMVKAQIEGAARAQATDDGLHEAQTAIPHTGDAVAKAVHDHPTAPACVVPDASVDGLQDGIRAGEAATAR